MECGGGGAQPRRYVKIDDHTYDITVFVTRIRIPSELSNEQDSILALAVEAFAVELGFSTSRKLAVEFNL